MNGLGSSRTPTSLASPPRCGGPKGSGDGNRKTPARMAAPRVRSGRPLLTGARVLVDVSLRDSGMFVFCPFQPVGDHRCIYAVARQRLWCPDILVRLRNAPRQHAALYFFRIRCCFRADRAFLSCTAFGSGSSDSGCHSRCTSSLNDPARSRFRLNFALGAFTGKSVTVPNSSSHIFFITIWRPG